LDSETNELTDNSENVFSGYSLKELFFDDIYIDNDTIDDFIVLKL
jgi:hypothetical protein